MPCRLAVDLGPGPEPTLGVGAARRTIPASPSKHADDAKAATGVADAGGGADGGTVARVFTTACAGSSPSDGDGSIKAADGAGDEGGISRDGDGSSQRRSSPSGIDSTRQHGLLGGALGDGDAARMDGVRLRKLTANPVDHGLVIRTGTCRGRSTAPLPHNYDMNWDDRPLQTIRTDLLPALQVDADAEFPSPSMARLGACDASREDARAVAPADASAQFVARAMVKPPEQPPPTPPPVTVGLTVGPTRSQ